MKTKILAVDDGDRNLLALDALLGDMDVEIAKARSGEEALKAVLDAEFALILMDVRMPGMDGFETASLIRQRRQSRHIPIIFLTADVATDAHIFKGYSLGAVDFLYKPIIPEVLKAKVTAFVDLYRQAQEIEIRKDQLRLELEAQVRQRTCDLEKANRTLQSLIDSSPQAIVTMDLKRIVQSWNRAAERVFGWTSAEVVGRTLPFVPVVGQGHRQLIDRAFSGETITNVPIQRPRRDGGVVDLLVSITLVQDQSGPPASCLIVASDITEQRRLERQLFRAQRLESIGALASGIAHDLNNVLAPILMGIQLVRDRLQDESDQSTLSLLETSAKRGANLIKQVLTFARGFEGERVPVQVRHLLRDVEKIVGSTFPKSIRIVPDASRCDLPPVLADGTQLHQVFMNLCVNARDAMPDGGTVAISAGTVTLDGIYAAAHPPVKPGTYVRVEISDSGIGISDSIIDKIFDPFFTTKDVNKGTGLGLSTVDSIVKNHGGFVTVNSTVGKGTSFRIFLPALADPEAHRTEKVVPASLPSGHGELVLVVDDEASMRDITKVTLEHFGYRVVTATNGAEGIAMYAQHASDIRVIVSDMNMPVMGGDAMIQALRAINPEVRVLSTSGLPRHGLEKPSGGFSASLNKPYTAEQLLQKLDELLRM